MSESSPVAGSGAFDPTSVTYPVGSPEYGLDVAQEIAAVTTQYDLAVEHQEHSIITQVEERALPQSESQKTLWAERHRSLAIRPQRNVMTLVEAHSSGLAPEVSGPDGVLIDGVFAVVIENEGRPGQEKRGFRTGAQLAGLLEGNRLGDRDMHRGATEALALLGQYGLYRMGVAGDPAQLLEALALMEAFAQVDPDFNPVEAAYGELVYHTIVLEAVLNADMHFTPQLAVRQQGLGKANRRVFGHLARIRAFASVRPHPNRYIRPDMHP